VVENHSADVNMVDEFGDTPLHYACQYADAERASEMVDYLISRGAKIGAVAKDGNTPFLVAAGFGGSGLKVAKKLASLDPALIRAVDAKGRDALHHACDGGGKRDLVEWLLELKDETTNQPLFPMQGDWLITLFGFGATDKTAGLVELFISRGAKASVDSKGNNLVHLAAGFGVGSAALVGLAVEKLNLDVNEANSEGLTPLHLACGFGCGVSGVISCLIELKASVNSKDSAGDTPLHHAIANYDTLSHKEATLELLVKAGADIHQANNSGFSPLEAAKGSDCASDIIPIILGEKSAAAVTEDPVIDLDFNFNDSDSDSGESKLLDFEW
jgi:ankyrin repeat protein